MGLALFYSISAKKILNLFIHYLISLRLLSCLLTDQSKSSLKLKNWTLYLLSWPRYVIKVTFGKTFAISRKANPLNIKLNPPKVKS